MITSWLSKIPCKKDLRLVNWSWPQIEHKQEMWCGCRKEEHQGFVSAFRTLFSFSREQIILNRTAGTQMGHPEKSSDGGVGSKIWSGSKPRERHRRNDFEAGCRKGGFHLCSGGWLSTVDTLRLEKLQFLLLLLSLCCRPKWSYLCLAQFILCLSPTVL